MNKTHLGGNLTRDPELTTLKNGTKVVKFGLAVNSSFKKQDGSRDVLFIDCQAWAARAEVIAQHFQKGKAILVHGELKLDQWEDKDGNKRSKIWLNVEDFNFPLGGSRDDSGSEGETQAAPARASKPAKARAKPSAEPVAEDVAVDDDIPF